MADGIDATLAYVLDDELNLIGKHVIPGRARELRVAKARSRRAWLDEIDADKPIEVGYDEVRYLAVGGLMRTASTHHAAPRWSGLFVRERP